MSIVPGQLSPSVHLCLIVPGPHRVRILLEHLQVWDEVLDHFLDVLRLLAMSISVVAWPIHSEIKYLVMLDEGVHTTQGSLEGREPIGGLSRYIQENLQAIPGPLPLRWESRLSINGDPEKMIDPLTSTWV